jgi:tRNA G10  N-methylase Trm11
MRQEDSCMMRMANHKQPTYAFIPGKNWKLSLSEVVAFLQTRKWEFKIADLSKFFFILTTEEALSPSFIEDLGGTIKVGSVVSELSSETVTNAFLYGNKQAQAEVEGRLSADHVSEEAFEASPKKCIFGVSLYFEDRHFLKHAKEMQRFMGNYLKRELAPRGIKARFMGFPRNRKLPQLTHVEVLKKNLIEKSAEMLFCIGRDQTYIAKTTAVHNPFEFQKRDVERPVQRKIFSIPPRLARIMVNLSSCTAGKVLLDPFCGVGTILQEAMLARAQVIGMDINPWCAKASSTNLAWLKDEYKIEDGRWAVLLGDSRRLTEKIDIDSVDCIATEPDLGPALRHLPTESYAQRIAGKLKPLYCDFLEEIHKVLRDGGRLVTTSPYIRTRNETFVALGIEKEAERIGFSPVYPIEKRIFVNETPLTDDLPNMSSFVDIEERHKIGREIHILQK